MSLDTQQSIEPSKVKSKRKPGGGRTAALNSDDVTYVRDNPDQLSYSELARKFLVTVQTIRKVVRGRGVYSNDRSPVV